MTPNPPRLDARSAPGALQVEHCDIPAHMTLDEWRRRSVAERRAAASAEAHSRRRRGLRRLLGG
jgi:hypothetical protein